jgi:hypothetical protein
MHLNLLAMLPTELREKIDLDYQLIIQLKPHERFQLWPRLRPVIYYATNDELIRQASQQYLAHHDCMIANTLFGLSLCPRSSTRGPITSTTAAEQYLNTGIRNIFKHKETIDFSWLTEHHLRLWQHCCHSFLIYAYRSNYWNDDVVAYAESQCDPAIFKEQA